MDCYTNLLHTDGLDKLDLGRPRKRLSHPRAIEWTVFVYLQLQSGFIKTDSGGVARSQTLRPFFASYD